MARKIVFVVSYFVEIDSDEWEGIYNVGPAEAIDQMTIDLEESATRNAVAMIKTPKWSGVARIPGDKAFATLKPFSSALRADGGRVKPKQA